jgi:membrane protein DedA with SNARE-associated domain
MGNLDSFLDLYGLAAIFILLLVKAAGIPIPIPADLIMLAAAGRAAQGKLVLWQTFVAILLALLIGGVIQFLLVKGPARRVLYRVGPYLGMTPARLDKVAERMQKGGVMGVSVAILTPGIRSVTIAACGLAGLPVRVFTPGLLLGSAAFLTLHFALGYLGGSLLNTSAAPVLVILVLLLIIGFVGWVIIRKRQHPQASTTQVVEEAFGAWHEAACPACLVLGAASKLNIQPDVVRLDQP